MGAGDGEAGAAAGGGEVEGGAGAAPAVGDAVGADEGGVVVGGGGVGDAAFGGGVGLDGEVGEEAWVGGEFCGAGEPVFAAGVALECERLFGFGEVVGAGGECGGFSSGGPAEGVASGHVAHGIGFGVPFDFAVEDVEVGVFAGDVEGELGAEVDDFAGGGGDAEAVGGFGDEGADFALVGRPSPWAR